MRCGGGIMENAGAAAVATTPAPSPPASSDDYPQIADVGPSGPSHLWQFSNKIPLDRGDRLGHIVHLAFDAGGLVDLRPHGILTYPSKDAHRLFPLDTETLPKEDHDWNQGDADRWSDPLVFVTLSRDYAQCMRPPARPS